jgi:hypothetical protein
MVVGGGAAPSAAPPRTEMRIRSPLAFTQGRTQRLGAKVRRGEVPQAFADAPRRLRRAPRARVARSAIGRALEMPGAARPAQISQRNGDNNRIGVPQGEASMVRGSASVLALTLALSTRTMGMPFNPTRCRWTPERSSACPVAERARRASRTAIPRGASPCAEGPESLAESSSRRLLTTHV